MKGESYISFDSQASYTILDIPKVDPKPRPRNVPALDFDGLPVYVSSSSESSPQQNKIANVGAGAQPIIQYNAGGKKKGVYKEDEMHGTGLGPGVEVLSRGGLNDDEEEDEEDE